jgi:7-carboxy-7-deazaguanine synthase
MTLTAPPPALIVSDIVGPVLRGEGPSLGRRCTTIRLGGCNLACSWCDSPQDWDGSRFDLSAELSHRLVRNVAADALAGGEGLVVITGGEPLRQQAQEGWPALLHLLADVEVEVETNGTYLPTDDSLRGVTRFVVSPKLANSGTPAWVRLKPEALARWADVAHHGQAVFNFVVVDETDVETVSSLIRLYRIPPSHTYVMFEGTTRDAVLAGTQRLAASVLAAGLNLTTRLGVLVDAVRSQPAPGRTTPDS